MIQQLALIEAESDDALLLPREEAAKRYTASGAEKIAHRRDCILAMIGWGMPADQIAKHAHCNHRIVKALGAKYSQRVADSTSDMVKFLRTLALKAAFLAGQKLEDAKVGELSVFMGVALQRSQEMEMASAGATDVNESIDVEADDPKRAAFVERLKQLAETNGHTN